jgi:hypothetical protein
MRFSMDRIQIKPGQKVSLVLTDAERAQVLNKLMHLDPELEVLIRKTSPGQPIRMSVDDLDLLGDCVAAEGNHTKDKKLGRSLDRIFTKIERLQDSYTDDEPPKVISLADDRTAKLVAEQGKWAKAVLRAATQLRIKTKPVERLPLKKIERVVLATLPALQPKLRNKLVKEGSTFTVAEVVSMTTAIAEALPGAEALQEVTLLFIAKKLMECIQELVARSANRLEKAKRKR